MKVCIATMISGGVLLLSAASWAVAGETNGEQSTEAKKNASTAQQTGTEALVAAGQSSSANMSAAASSTDKPLKVNPVNPSDFVKDGVGCGVPGLQTTNQQ
jgi:hypothetical protein